MVTDWIGKLRLCMTEVVFCQELIDNKDQVDEWHGRFLAVYMCVRLDDIVKIMGKSIPKDAACRVEFDIIKDRYNEIFRKIRDKIGSHFQSVSKSADPICDDMFERVGIYSSLNYNGITDIVSAAGDLFRTICVAHGADPAVEALKPADRQILLDYCSAHYMGDCGQLGVDAFALASPNTGFMISCSAAQRKAQLIKSLELMADTGKALCSLTFGDVRVSRMLKRIYVCAMVNFYDNLFTRDISGCAPQYDPGFDRYIGELATKQEPKETLEGYFEKFREMYPDVASAMESIRKVRDMACAHLDLDSPVEAIDKATDDLIPGTIDSLYEKVRNFWNWLLGNVFLLGMLNIPARNSIPLANFEKMEGISGFYGAEEEADEAKDVSGDGDICRLWRDIVKDSPRRNESREVLKRILFDHRNVKFHSVLDYLFMQLCKEGLGKKEGDEILYLIDGVRHGCPDEIFDWMLDICGCCHIKSGYGNIIWLMLLAGYARGETTGRIDCIIRKLLDSPLYVHRCYGSLILLGCMARPARMTRVAVGAGGKDIRMHDFLSAVDNPVARTAIAVALCSRWFSSPYFVTRKETVTQCIVGEMESALEAYFNYARTEAQRREELLALVGKNRFGQLNYMLGAMEADRKQTENPFKDNIRWTLVWPCRNDRYEACYHALSLELIGERELALLNMEDVQRCNPLDRDILKVLDDMRERMR